MTAIAVYRALFRAEIIASWLLLFLVHFGLGIGAGIFELRWRLSHHELRDPRQRAFLRQQSCLRIVIFIAFNIETMPRRIIEHRYIGPIEAQLGDFLEGNLLIGRTKMQQRWDFAFAAPVRGYAIGIVANGASYPFNIVTSAISKIAARSITDNGNLTVTLGIIDTSLNVGQRLAERVIAITNWGVGTMAT